MKKLTFILAAVCLPAALAACGGGSGKPTSGSTTQAVGTGEEGDRCGGFVANPQQCDESANLYCKASRVPDMPGTCTSCDQYGPAPISPVMMCPDGNTYTAHWVAQNGGCAVQVCPDGSAGTPVNGSSGGGSNNQCQQASDCTGILPHLCMQCADGSSQCAHFDCNQGSCQQVTCDDIGGPAAQCTAIVECVIGMHWDATQCACAADTSCFQDSDCANSQSCNFSMTASDGSGYCAPTGS